MVRPELPIDFKLDQGSSELLGHMGCVWRNFERRLRAKPITCALLKHLPDRRPWPLARIVHEDSHQNAGSAACGSLQVIGADLVRCGTRAGRDPVSGRKARDRWKGCHSRTRVTCSDALVRILMNNPG